MDVLLFKKSELLSKLQVGGSSLCAGIILSVPKIQSQFLSQNVQAMVASQKIGRVYCRKILVIKLRVYAIIK